MVGELALLAAVVASVHRALPDGPAPPAASPAPAAATFVSAHPSRYSGREITVGGRVGERPARRSARDRWAFLPMGNRRNRLLVVPARGIRMTVFRQGTPVVVHGRVTVPRRRHLVHLPPSARARVAVRNHARAILKADHVSVEG